MIVVLFIFLKHWEWSRSDGRGGTITYTYYDEITWVVGGLALAWLTWFLVNRYRRLRALRRPPRRRDRRSLDRVIKAKRELSSRYLRPGFSNTIHAVGVGIVDGGPNEYCIQVFLNDPNEELWVGSGAEPLPDSYAGIPVIPVEMAAAGFLAETQLSSPADWHTYSNGIRDNQEIIIGGISGANTNLTGQSGTIGYFCTRRSKLRRRKEIHLLSNAHVFADLRKAKADEADLIVQPSPGEPASNRPVGTLANYSTLKFDDLNAPNHVDAAIANLWGPQLHDPLIPLIGAIKGQVQTKDVEIGEAARKFGRTTGYTEGRIFSIYLDIWIRYDRTGQSAFFQDQFLIEPATPQFTKFAAKGDSGSLLVDAGQHAIGLIFAGTSEAPKSPPGLLEAASSPHLDMSADKPKRVEGYGVANPITQVLDSLKIDLLV